MSTRLTKAQLLAKIDALEAELGLERDKSKALAIELDAYHYTQRPSRRLPSVHDRAILTRREQMRAARELAMRTGAVVKVMQ